MKVLNGHLRICLGVALSIVIGAGFSFGSFAAPDAGSPDDDRTVALECSGTLTIKSGSLNVDGNPVQTGATIMTGTILATSSDGDSVIDFGPVGRIELGNSTTVTLTCIGELLQIRSHCPKTYIKVHNGKVDVTHPKTEILESGKDEKYNDATEATAVTGTDWYVDCVGRKPVGLWIGPGWAGIVALAGVGTAVVVGVTNPIGEEVPISPIR